jgi:tetratricopeptide (TPR) repeat protein
MKREGEIEIGDHLKKLLAEKELLVPFIGAGFSVPACPTWSGFLEQYFLGLKENFLLSKDERFYLKLKKSKDPNRFEKIADWLIKKSGKGEFYHQVNVQFNKPLLPEMQEKFKLLHKSFPGLKITTNYDCFIETSSFPGSHVETCRGSQHTECERLLTYFKENSLVKIHGGVKDMNSIVLSSSQYADLYGHPTGFDINAPLPAFLERLFCNFSLLFIGCSLVFDRTLMILKSLTHTRPHFALMRKPGNGKGKDKRNEWVEVNHRLSSLNITPVWLEDYEEIEEVLQKLAGTPFIYPHLYPGEPGHPFVGREKELRKMEKNLDRVGGTVQTISGRLFNLDGAGGVGKTTLALEAARRFSHLFPDGVLPLIRVDEHTPISFAMHLSRHFNLLNVPEPADEKEAQALVTTILKKRRVLLILDNAVDWKDLRYMLPLESAAAIIVTTRSRDMHKHIRLTFSRFQVEEISLEKFTPEEALALFRAMLDQEYRPEEEEIYLQIAENLGFLPIALRQAISLMLFGPHYSAPMLRDKLKKEDRLALLGKGQAVEESDSRAVEAVFDLSSPLLTNELTEALKYLSVCAPGPVPLNFLEQLSKEKSIGESLERLYTLSWCERREMGETRSYELHQLVRELVNRRFECPFVQEFIRLVHDIFTDDSVHFSIKDDLMPQLEEAFCLAAGIKDSRLTDWLYDLYDFCTRRGYSEFYIRLTQTVETLFPDDRWTLEAVLGNRALVFKALGKLKEAMELHKKEEKIKEELGDRAGLAACYGNQALILKAWGKVQEAMTLHKKEEKICEELGDRAGLARSYGNQALILSDWGKLKEAMTLHKKDEKICEELGDRAGLAACYGNQALILKAWGNLQEAMTLHKKQEKIYEELGERKGLALSYCGQALILSAWGKRQEAMTLHKKEEKICEEFGGRAGLARSYGNQALILKAWGKLHEAMRLHKKEETIYEELGDRAGLARSYGNQALILKAWGKLKEAMRLHKKEETIHDELGDRAGLAITWWNQGIIHGDQGDMDKKIDLWKKSIAVN